ncbi:putativediacetylphloroglucinol specific hydrolase [Diaporthe ampelina]|uniref:Putativediacetylphloroglucinol specific hydrolase n=1 Tax=Diaporthe ampelina TaxID=1214573 RepID=A0A0G2H8W7_9PEZI|nr:putativediacetylphloroglucinol specific hydrolase [Diaporthe ampelina]
MPSTSSHSTGKGGHDGDNRRRDPSLVPVTYYPLVTQQQHTIMQQRMAGKPYAHYFHDPPLYIRREALDAIARPISSPAKNVLPLSQARRLLEPGDHAAENGWHVRPDGTGYVASKTQFPGCTGEMVDWWFWWHSVEGERYALWYPHNHCGARSTYARRTTSGFTPVAGRDPGTGRALPILEREDVPHRQKWLGSTHTVSEFVGPLRVKLRIEFKEPSYFGLGTWEELEEAGYEAAVCGLLWDKALPLKVGDMIHLWRRTENGLELRSRYYLAHQVYVDVFGLKVSVDWIGGLLGIKRAAAGAKVAYEQLLHDQTEFTNLASFLPEIYREFGQQKGQGTPTSSARSQRARI